MDWEKNVCKTYNSQLINRIYEGILQTDKQKPIIKWVNYKIRKWIEKIQMVNKHKKMRNLIINNRTANLHNELQVWQNKKTDNKEWW